MFDKPRLAQSKRPDGIENAFNITIINITLRKRNSAISESE